MLNSTRESLFFIHHILDYPCFNSMEKDLQYDLKLPYTIQIRQINDKNGNHFYARVVELDGCQSDGKQ